MNASDVEAHCLSATGWFDGTSVHRSLAGFPESNLRITVPGSGSREAGIGVPNGFRRGTRQRKTL